MGDVVIDGEKVEFDGSAPQTCRDACTLIEGFLSGQGKMIESISLDGERLDIEAAFQREAYRTLEFTTTSPQAQLLTMCKGWKSGAVSLIEEMDTLSSSILRSRWNDNQTAVVSLLEKLRPLIEGLGVLQGYGKDSAAEWTSGFEVAFQRGLEGIDQVVSAVESRKAALLSDRVAANLVGGWTQIVDCLGDQVIVSLEKEIAA